MKGGVVLPVAVVEIHTTDNAETRKYTVMCSDKRDLYFLV